MAESFASDLVEKVLEKLVSLAFQEIYLAWGVKDELKELEDTLSTIKAVILDAEEQQSKNHQVSVWLGKLKDVCYDADDVLDEFEYEALRWQEVNHGGIKRKVCNFFSCSNPLAFRFKMGHKIRSIREKLDKVANEKAKFHLTNRVDDRRVVHMERETHSFVQASDVIGREDDKENIVQLLMRASDHENVSVVPIVGIGGLGKTTLARLVYNDEMVVRHFKLKMWVCVSDDFDIKKLTKEIINCATGNNCGDLSMEQMQTILRDILRDTLFLLILDDVWNKDHGKWIELKNLLSGGANGSKIIVTTRSPLVASIVHTVPVYNLDGLSHEDCMSLFVKWAFRKGEEKRYPNLLKIGEDIVEKCRGVPLAVRTLGSLLYLKTDERDWLYIKDNEIWKLEQKENDIFPALRLSYAAMPAYLKQCFAFCSIFPKDKDFNNVELTILWMAHGLLQSSIENEELEDIAQRYIQELWSRSFFQDLQKENMFLTFKMHDLVHNLTLWVAQTECSTINSHTQNVSKRVRHVSCWEEDCSVEKVSRFFLKLDNVRTIMFPVGGSTSQSFVKMCISKFKCLRVLDLRGSNFKVLPSSIGNLKHMRFLNLTGNVTIQKLPNSVCKLWHLQSLVLSDCEGLEELPIDIGNLINIRFLEITTKQVFLPEEGIGRLISLRYLLIGNCENLRSLGDGILQRLTALRTLAVQGCRSLESLPHSIKYLAALETLSIRNCENLNLRDSEEDIQGLRFSLRSLFLTRLPHLVALPQWLQGAAKTLQHISIVNCRNLKALPDWLQNLTSLQKLVIVRCPELSRRCEQETGEDWPKISLVPDITIDGEKIKSIDT